MGANNSVSKVPSSNSIRTRNLSSSRLSQENYAQELDMFFVRQIARRLGEYDLEQKIDLEIKMREGTTKLLAACKHPTQSLEAAKSLLTSNQRMSAYMTELQERKALKLHADKKRRPRTEMGSRAKVSISDIRMPLIWKDTDHFKNKGDYRRFAVFCMLKVGSEIYDTALINNVDRSMTDISFEDVAVFHHIPSNFDFDLEVYCRVLQDDLSIASTPRKIKKKITSSVSRTFGRKMAASLKDDYNSETGPKFELIARAKLKLSDAHDSIKTHDLLIENIENRQAQLPLFGHYCCRLAVQPDCVAEESLSGYLKVLEHYFEKGAANGEREVQHDEHLYWASLKNFSLSLWIKRSQDTPGKSLRSARDNPPDIIIPVKQTTKTKRGSNSFTVISAEGEVFVISVLNKDDLQLWVSHIDRQIQDHLLWDAAAETVMEILTPSPTRNPLFMNSRAPGALYDETPLSGPTNARLAFDSVDSTGGSPSSSLRSRSSVTSSETGSSSASQANLRQTEARSKSASRYSSSSSNHYDMFKAPISTFSSTVSSKSSPKMLY